MEMQTAEGRHCKGNRMTRFSAALTVSPRGEMDHKGKNRALLLPVIAGHDALHELIKQGNGESRVAVAWTPDHALGDQLAPGRAERRDPAAKLFGNIP